MSVAAPRAAYIAGLCQGMKRIAENCLEPHKAIKAIGGDLEEAVHSSPPDDWMQRAAPEPEITPEMIEAGTLAFADYDYRFESEETMVERIYRAMYEIRRPD